MAYAEDKAPDGLTELTSLASGDVFVVGDISDAVEEAKYITYANLITDLADETQTFTNKTIDQDGTGNSITNIANASIKAAAGISMSKTALVAGTGLTLTTDTLSVDAAQTQITSVGTLTSLQLGGDLNLDGNNIDNGGVIFLKEQADADADVAGSAQIWVNTATPNELWWTDDAGTDFQVASLAGTETFTNKTINTASNTITINEADISDLGTTAAMVADNLSVFAATTSAQLAGVISDETGSGSLVFATSPTLVTPALGTPASGVLTNTTGYPGDSSLVTTGALNSGSITSGFGNIDIGASTFDTTGAVATGALTVTGVANVSADIVFTEQADHTSTPGAGFGYLWTKNTVPSTLIFTDDAGTDITLGSGGAGISNVVEDTTPQLGGDLDVNGNKILSVANGNIEITPNGTGEVIISDGSGGVNADDGPLEVNANADNLLTIGAHATSAIPGISTYHSRGNTSAPSASQSGDNIFFMGGRGYGSTGYASNARGVIRVKTTQNWTDANQGTEIAFETTPDNSTTRAEQMQLDDGGLSLTTGNTYQINDVDVLSATTLGSAVVSSSLTTVGTLTAGNADAIVSAASTTTAGKVELATAAETTTGTDATRAVSPDGLAGSDFGIRYVQAICFDFTTDTATGDGKFYFHVPAAMDGMNLVEVHAEVITAGTTGTTDIQIHNVDNALDMLSTKLTIDSAETGSDTAAAAAVINTSNDHVNENDVVRIDVDAVSTTAAKGLIVTMGFQLP